MAVSPDSRINKKLKKSKEARNKQAKKRNEKRAETKKNKKDKGSLSSRIGNFLKKADARAEKKRTDFEKKVTKSKIDKDRPRAKEDKKNRKYPGLSKVVKAEKVRKNKNENVKKKRKARAETVKQTAKNLNKEDAKKNRKYPGIIANQKADETYESNTNLKVTSEPSSPTQSDAPKKFDYKNKKKTKMSNSKGKRNARGRSSSDIAKDPSFMKNTSKGKYLRGIHSSLLKQGMASGGAVKKLSTKPSAGNKWN